MYTVRIPCYMTELRITTTQCPRFCQKDFAAFTVLIWHFAHCMILGACMYVTLIVFCSFCCHYIIFYWCHISNITGATSLPLDDVYCLCMLFNRPSTESPCCVWRNTWCLTLAQLFPYVVRANAWQIVISCFTLFAAFSADGPIHMLLYMYVWRHILFCHSLSQMYIFSCVCEYSICRLAIFVTRTLNGCIVEYASHYQTCISLFLSNELLRQHTFSCDNLEDLFHGHILCK